MKLVPRPSSLVLDGLVALAILWPSSAGALTITYADCALDAGNALRFNCDVETDVEAVAQIEFCDADVYGTSCTKNQTSPAKGGVYSATGCAGGSPCWTYALTAYNMVADHDYEYQAYAWKPAATDTSVTDTETTGSLPSPGLDDIAFTVSGSGNDVEYLAFNYGCSTSSGNYGDYAIIADDDGNIVWYEDVRDVTGESSSQIRAIAVLNGHVAVVVDNEWFIEYNLDGTVVASLSRDAGDLEDGDSDDRYVHHDIWRDSSYTYLVTAKDYDYTDVNDCDGDSSTTDTITFILDGLFMFDSSWALVDEWDLSEIYDPSSCFAFTSSPGGYWAGLLSGGDWAHMNSIATHSGTGDWLMSLNRLSRVIQVDEAYGSLDWELFGNNTSSGDGDWDIVASPTIATDDFNRQHAARWYGDRLMLFDNHNDDGINTSYSRGIEIELDSGMSEFDVVAEYEGDADCPATGSSMELTAMGNVLTACSGDDTFREFDSSGSTWIWDMQLECDSYPTYSHFGNIYRGIPVFGMP